MIINGKEYKSKRDYTRERDREVQAKISSTKSSSTFSGSHSSDRSSSRSSSSERSSSERSSSTSYTPSFSSLVSSPSYTRPSSGGSSYGGGASASRDYHQEAQDAAARGDWSAVTRALAARQAKIDAQGGNDRGTSNAQILQNLQNLYQSSYSALSDTARNTLGMAASGQLNGRGWEDGVDYLAQAKQYARAGDMEAAYDALRRRGFKMADTGSLGGGTSQDQAYALIQNLYDHSAGAAASYQGMLEENARRLQEHPTIFGNTTNPGLAGKHFTSADGKYIIYYDSNGTPFKAQPNNGQYGSTKYTPEYKALMEEYYEGSGDYADLRRQLHNLDVAYSGNGRLIDQNWNWASGEAAPTRDAYQYWTDFDNDVGWNRNTGQDKDALANILARINQGETFSSPTQVPITRTYTESYDDIGLPSRKASGGGGSGGGGNGLTASSVQYGAYDGQDLTQYIRDMYQQSLEAQLAQLQAGYEQNAAGLRAQDERIAQAYQQQRNQAAGQSDLQRMYMAELGNYQGLNTGATGQMAMAQGMSLQNQLAALGAAENQDLAANGLALSQLGIGYQGSVNSALAQNSAQMAGALYDEYVRQIQAEEAARQAAQAQANWEAQFNYQMQQDALAQQYQQQAAQLEYQQQMAQIEAAAGKQNASNAWDYAQLLLKNGVMPDEATLYAAGLDAGSAQSLADSYKWQLGQKYAPKTTSGKSSGRSSNSSPVTAKTQDYSGLFNAAYANGYPTSFIANNYGAYGFDKSTGLADEYEDWAFDSGKMDAYLRDINTAMTNGNTVAANSYISSIWPGLSGREKEQIQSLLSRYNGIQYTP